MSVAVTPGLTGIDFNPATVVEEVIQNVAVILSTMKGEQPLFRDLGLTRDWQDLPTPEMKARYVVEVTEEIPLQEPRARVTKVDWLETKEEQSDGTVVPRVWVKIDEEVELG